MMIEVFNCPICDAKLIEQIDDGIYECPKKGLSEYVQFGQNCFVAFGGKVSGLLDKYENPEELKIYLKKIANVL